MQNNIFTPVSPVRGKAGASRGMEDMMQKKTFEVYNNSNRAVRDAYSMLIANLRVCCNEEKELKTFLITSSNPREGKTSVSISLAAAAADLGLKILLIDSDVRKPGVAKRLNKDIQYGLSDYLSGDLGVSSIVCETNVENLDYISCGNDYRNPIGILSSQKFEKLLVDLRPSYDMIFLDSSALSSVVDGYLIASKADATLLVVKPGEVSLTNLKRVKEQLEKFNANFLGVVLNEVKRRDYKTYYGAYQYFFDTDKFIHNKKKS